MCMNRLPSGSDRNTTPCGARRGTGVGLSTSVVSTPSRLMRKSPMLGACASMRPSSSAASASTVPSRRRSRAARYAGREAVRRHHRVAEVADPAAQPDAHLVGDRGQLPGALLGPGPRLAHPDADLHVGGADPLDQLGHPLVGHDGVRAVHPEHDPCRVAFLGLVDRLLDEVRQDRVERTADLGHRRPRADRPGWADPGPPRPPIRSQRTMRPGRRPPAGAPARRGGTGRTGTDHIACAPACLRDPRRRREPGTWTTPDSSGLPVSSSWRARAASAKRRCRPCSPGPPPGPACRASSSRWRARAGWRRCSTSSRWPTTRWCWPAAADREHGVDPGPHAHPRRRAPRVPPRARPRAAVEAAGVVRVRSTWSPPRCPASATSSSSARSSSSSGRRAPTARRTSSSSTRRPPATRSRSCSRPAASPTR